MFANVLEIARQLIRERVSSGETVIDATMGNGNDTVFLARLVEEEGKVIAYDIQEQALAKTRERLVQQELAERVELKLASHEEMALLDTQVAAVMFNLGYLPGSDKQVTTMAQSTIRAIQAGLELLRPGGMMTIMVYWGHPAGVQEKETVESFCQQLDQTKYLVLKYQYLNQKNSAPYLLAIERRA
ncbi:class I SAM-dependent methyltransferase [Brevibacillus sp. TJ4]|uniref:class I SAM-dependent methyltransferase n=1 Tax=Brevibacillus sp. TJ4 TaxID=3234853 RepID=UPI0037D556AA